jgi:hypothetical protein
MPVNNTMVDVKPTVEANPMNIATISAGFEKGDFLVREEQGNRVYFDFFEEVRASSSIDSFYRRQSFIIRCTIMHCD